jgi:lipopolysaccharide transport system ATP-binding protein
MSNIAISVENLSKRYRIGLMREKQDTLLEAFIDLVQRPLQNLGHLRSLAKFTQTGCEPEDVIWALKDVSLEVKKGEVIGIIGSNGAGKTTLLKILSRITHPTEGQVVVRGRVGSLLEVGTGFHPDLTGRENIYLNGTILGMRKGDIDRKFDEIVDFSGVERFIDTPVKRYSSGMRVRLAFAVAAHVDPDILMVDEVLAVGDAMFQEKCLKKMDSISGEGRTVLFVSHNLPVLQNLCPEAILLANGRLKERGNSSKVVETYLEQGSREGGEFIWNWSEDDKKALGPFIPLALRAKNHEGKVTDLFSSARPIEIELTYKLPVKVSNLRVGISLQTLRGEVLFSSYDRDNPAHDNLYARDPGTYVSRCTIPGDWLNDKAYCVGIISAIKSAQKLYRNGNVLMFKVDATDGVGAHWAGSRGGILRPNLGWTTEIVAPLSDDENIG